MSNQKDTIIHLIAGLIKNISFVSKRHYLQATNKNDSILS